MTTDFKQGSVVYSVKGRDKGVFYVCVSPVKDNYVFVSDGATHKLNKPKERLVALIMEKENVDFGKAVLFFMLFALEGLGYHI